MSGPLTEPALLDRYEKRTGVVHLTGIQALARLPIDQARRDHALGRNVGTFISGYEGSPLAGYDLELQRQTALLDKHNITFEPGLNEELAATAVQGSQFVAQIGSRVDGVVGFWYGKAPGLDRASDALRHANLMGTHPSGGAVALVGDDPAAKSSSVPCASERSLADLGMPTFYPADAGEILELGRHAIALSRASGLWTALKIVTAVADGSATVDLLAQPPDPVIPTGSHAHEPTAKLLQPVLGPLERDFLGKRLSIASDYAVRNGLNPILGKGKTDRVGIVAAGKTFLDVKEALERLGVEHAELDNSPLRLLKVEMIWPLAGETVREFAEGLDEIIVVEEKRAFLETALRDLLYEVPDHPKVSGKRDPHGSDLLAAHGELDADAVTLALAERLAEHSGFSRASRWITDRRKTQPSRRTQLPLLQRAPYFCSGCPHNTSTRPHVESPVGAGIGCHAMVLLMDEDQVGDVLGLTQMGGEGAQWLGMAPFVTADHFVQNLGDGTFHHSGSLAIRAAVAARANITYRLLYNGTVAMTGGQAPVGGRTLADLVANLRSEGVSRIIVTTDDRKQPDLARLPRDVAVWDRKRVAAAEQALAATPGVTVLVHVQECATELRRKRKRGKLPAPRESVVINERLCEGCGDCGEKSNCLSVHPIDTEFGRKTTIHQESCNTDLTCLSGDCPAFMTVRDGSKPAAGNIVDQLDATTLTPPAPMTRGTAQQVRLMGIGGAGVVTTSQVLATAAVLVGRHVRTLDQTGLAQKGGSVISDVKISDEPILGSNKIAEADCDLYLGYDLLTAADEGQLAVLGSRSTAILSTSVIPTGAMVSNKNVGFPDVPELVQRVSDRVGEGQIVAADVHAYVEPLFGSAQFANMFVLGIAVQRGALTLPPEAIERAIELNGVAVATNIQAFRRGRQYVLSPHELAEALRRRSGPEPSIPHRRPLLVNAPEGSELERLVTRFGAELVAFQNEKYALRYERLVERARLAEEESGVQGSDLAESVARYYFKLLAYKDEYEVARLALDPAMSSSLKERFGSDAKAAWKLHPPALRALGLQRKLTFGPWFAGVFKVLYAMRRLRGTVLDPFGYARVRKVERWLVTDYETTIETCLSALSETDHATAVAIARLPDQVRGYEEIKLRSVKTYLAEKAAFLKQVAASSESGEHSGQTVS